MSQTNLAYDELSRSQQAFAPLPAEETRRSPEKQAEFERLGKADTYLVLESDEELFNWLDDQRDLRTCGYVTASEGAGLHKACKYYQAQRVKQRKGKFLLPVSVVYAEVKQYGGPIDLYESILKACNHPLAHVGPLKDRRKRTQVTFSDYKTKALLVGNADYLALESLNELVDLSKSQQISVILVGTPFLTQILARNSYSYQRVHNSFLESHEFPLLEKKDVIEIVEDWEELFLPEDQRLKLASIPDVVDFLFTKSGKLREPLYATIRRIATLKLDEPSLKLTKSNLTTRLAGRKSPKTKSSNKEAG